MACRVGSWKNQNAAIPLIINVESEQLVDHVQFSYWKWFLGNSSRSSWSVEHSSYLFAQINFRWFLIILSFRLCWFMPFIVPCCACIYFSTVCICICLCVSILVFLFLALFILFVVTCFFLIDIILFKQPSTRSVKWERYNMNIGSQNQQPTEARKNTRQKKSHNPWNTPSITK